MIISTTILQYIKLWKYVGKLNNLLRFRNIFSQIEEVVKLTHHLTLNNTYFFKEITLWNKGINLRYGVFLKVLKIIFSSWNHEILTVGRKKRFQQSVHTFPIQMFTSSNKINWLKNNVRTIYLFFHTHVKCYTALV